VEQAHSKRNREQETRYDAARRAENVPSQRVELELELELKLKYEGRVTVIVTVMVLVVAMHHLSSLGTVDLCSSVLSSLLPFAQTKMVA
jgi:hypothetical protein